MILKSHNILVISLLYFCSIIQKYEFFNINPDKDLSQFKDPCASLKCHLDEICVAKDDDTAVCIQRSQLEINEKHNPNSLSKRDVSKPVQYCGSSECRFGECEIRNMTSFVCHCFKGVTGSNCNMLDTTGLACASNPCFGDSFCIDLAGNAICICEDGRVGPQCIDILGSCQCQNGGKCIQQLVGAFRCECPEGYGGHLCQYKIERKKSCPDGCFNGGICNTTTNTCKCPLLFKGKRCEITLTTTTKKPFSNFIFTKFTLPQARTTQFNINICSEKTCLNGGTCIQLDQLSAICLCTSNYNGPYCNLESKYDSTSKAPLVHTAVSTIPKLYRTTTKTTTKTTTEIIDENEEDDEQLDEEDEEEIELQPDIPTSIERLPCPSIIPNPCLNKGICMYLGYDITCKCPVTYAGTFCTERTEFCSKEPCRNNAVCKMTGKYDGKCICKPGYSGQFCEVGLKCNPNPCKNDQPCLLIDGIPRCFCTSKFTPPYCDL